MIMNLPAAYHILDLPVGSSLEVVQVRYRKLVKKYHPDRFANAADKASAEARLKQINEAKEVIQKHWFEAKIKASDPIPSGAPSANKSSASASGASGSSASTPKSKPSSASSAPPRQSNSAAKAASKTPLDEALEQLDKPFRFTSETKLRRIWYAIAIVIVVDVVATGYIENLARQRADLATWRESTPVAANQYHSQSPTPEDKLDKDKSNSEIALQQIKQTELKEQQKRLETAIYFKRLELDAAEKAIRKDGELIDEIEIKLQSEDMANESRRSLENMKDMRERDQRQKELERTSILEELSQLQTPPQKAV
ncbi:hypothetical protein BH11CYA1_BH11CYA1_07470 [soil metagenome]